MKTKTGTRREFLKNIGWTAAALTLSCGTGLYHCSKHNKRPANFVIIFTDDQGYADIGCYGAKGFATPNLDRLAAEGMRFTDFYVSQAVCSASRASLLTGCYSGRVGIQGALVPWSHVGLNPQEETIAEVLKKSNYTSAIFGKWHLGSRKEFLPLQHGFDEYFGLPYSNDMWPVDYNGAPVTLNSPGSGFGKLRYPPLPLIEGNEKAGEIRSLVDQSTLTTRYTERAVRFIEKNKSRPFFLYLPHAMPHVPLAVSDKFKGKSSQGLYGDVIMEIDWSVGEILKTLKKHGLEENTLIIFTSDNGPWLNFGNHGGSAFPLREGKGNMWEGGARVPCIMRWPGKIPAGTVCRKIAATIDILPTIAGIAGAPLPEKKIDGVNILPLLENRKNANPRQHYFFYYGRELRAVRQGRWKLYFPHEYRSYQGVEPGKDGYPGLYAKGKAGLELYDLENDISETMDVAGQYPGVVKQLQALAEKAREELGDRLTGKNGRGVREPGRKRRKKIRVQHLAVGKSITLKNKYRLKYTGGGDSALIDGIRGTANFTDNAWQGYEGNNLEALVDLGDIRNIKRVSCRFLESQVNWIFLPKAVEIALSKDGESFAVIKRSKQKRIKVNPLPQVKDIGVEILPVRPARYIRIKAENIGVCPAWHPGSGGKAWIFADEIIVQ